MRRLSKAAFVAVFMTCATMVQAQTSPSEEIFAEEYAAVAEARALYRESDFDGTLAIALPLAEAGNPIAQNLVGAVLTYRGYDGYDQPAGMAMLMRSAAAGVDRAWHNLGRMYLEDHDALPYSQVLALQHFRTSAEMGYVPSFEEMAYFRTFGDASVVDYDLAVDLINQGLALEPDNAYLLGLLGDHYYYGYTLPVDLVRALELYEIAATSGYSYAQFSAGYQYYFEEGTAYDVDVAISYFDQAAAQDYAAAFGHLAEIFSEGMTDQNDFPRALAYAERGTELGDVFSSVILGQLYQEGHGVDQDVDRARALYEQAYADGSAAGLENLADMAYFGVGEEVDLGKSYQLFQQVLAEFPNRPYTSYSIGFMLMRGEGVAADIPGAVSYLEDAYAGGSWDVIAEMPVIYGHPDFAGDHSDPVRAMAFCLLAADRDMLDGDAYDETIEACTLLEAEITSEQAVEAIELYQAL